MQLALTLLSCAARHGLDKHFILLRCRVESALLRNRGVFVMDRNGEEEGRGWRGRVVRCIPKEIGKRCAVFVKRQGRCALYLYLIRIRVEVRCISLDIQWRCAVSPRG